VLHRIASGDSLKTLRLIRHKVGLSLYLLPAVIGLYGFLSFVAWTS